MSTSLEDTTTREADMNNEVTAKIQSYQQCINLAKKLEKVSIFLHPDQIAKAFKVATPVSVGKPKNRLFLKRKKEVLEIFLHEVATPGSHLYLDALKRLSEKVENLEDIFEVCRHAAGFDYDIFDKNIAIYIKAAKSYQALTKCLEFERYMTPEQRELFYLKWIDHLRRQREKAKTKDLQKVVNSKF